ncbi:transcriptional regulator domain-containing protein [Sphingomonas sp. J344]|uniref:transcriptional regulator domain-containing protein n=1 Tax=unclassified Sphingomonas TaxID=196159 RepID=UPI0035AE9CDD
MWEWLRRDPGYISWYARASTATRGTGDAMPWGLHFRRASRPPGPGGADHLACRFRSRGNCRYRRVGGPVRSGQSPHRPDRALARHCDRRGRARACRAIRWLASYSARCRGGPSGGPGSGPVALQVAWACLSGGPLAAAQPIARSVSPSPLRPLALSQRCPDRSGRRYVACP